MSEAVDNLNPVDYALTTTNVDNGLTDLGFKFHGVNTSDPKDERSIWHKNLGRGIRAIVVTSANTPTRLNFFKVHIKGRGVFADTKELERRENIGVNDLRRIVMRWQTEAQEDDLDPMAYANNLLDPAKVLAELGFKFGGADENDLEFWIKKLSPRIVMVVNFDTQTGLINYRKVRLAKPNNLKGSFQVIDSAFNVPVLELRALTAKMTEAQEVIHRLLDADADALDPRGELERLMPNRCPECGSSNVSEADDEGLIDCMNCGIWFNPLHPNNAPSVPGNYPDPRTVEIIDYPIDAQGNRRPPGWQPPVDETLEDEIPDVKDYALRHGAKPFGYVLRSRVKGTGYPWMNTRWSDRSDCCGNFRRHLGDATVFKRQSTVKGYTGLDAVPVYSDPRKTGNRALSPYNVNEEHENPDDPENFIRDFIQRIPPLNPRICISFSQTTPESSEQGDYSDSGWIDEEGVEMTPDEFDQEEGLTAVDLAVKFLQNEGAMETSSSQFHPGVWYSTTWNTVNYRTGTDEERSFHLKDFSPAEEQAIWDKIHEQWNRARRPR